MAKTLENLIESLGNYLSKQRVWGPANDDIYDAVRYLSDYNDLLKRKEEVDHRYDMLRYAVWACDERRELSWADLQTMFGKYVVVVFPNSPNITPMIKQVYELSITEKGKFVHFNEDIEDFVAVEHDNPKIWKLAKLYPLEINLESYRPKEKVDE